MAPDPTPSFPLSLSQASELAVADLAERLDVAPDAVSMVASEEVTWRDGSLGCARPGDRYLMALVDGGRILLEVDGETYSYHYGGRRTPFWCEHPTQ